VEPFDDSHGNRNAPTRRHVWPHNCIQSSETCDFECDQSYCELMPHDFGPWLQALLAERGLSHRAFASAVGTSHSLIGSVCRGHRRADPEVLPLWAQKLGLSGAVRDAFIEAGKRARARGKQDISDYIDDLERRMTEIEEGYAARQDELAMELKALAEELDAAEDLSISGLLGLLRETKARLREAANHLYDPASGDANSREPSEGQ